MIKNVWYAFYLCHRKFRPMTQKNAPRDRTAAEWKSVAKATSCRRRILRAGFYFTLQKRKSLKNNIYHVILKTFAPAKECRLRDLNPHGIATNGF